MNRRRGPSGATYQVIGIIGLLLGVSAGAFGWLLTSGESESARQFSSLALLILGGSMAITSAVLLLIGLFLEWAYQQREP